MSLKSDKVKSGYTELTDSEKAEVKAFIKEYDDAGYYSKITLSERARQTFGKSLGPTSGNNCPCCGKS
jgi:hypothetical protein